MDFENIGKRMKWRREFLGWSLHYAANRIGCTPTVLLRWETGETASIKTTKLQGIADALMTTPAYLLGAEDLEQASANLHAITEGQLKRVPILGEIPCGDPKNEAENYSGEASVPSGYDCDFAVRARGDSMINARIFDGDLLLIKQQSMVENGTVAAVLINDEVTVKRFYLYPSRIELRPENPMHPVKNFEGAELANIKILGKVVAVIGEIK